MGWPTGAETKAWMRAQSVGDLPADLATLDETTAAATSILVGQLDRTLMEIAGTISTVALTANVATITYAMTAGTNPDRPAVGDTVTIAGIVPGLFDGTYVLTATAAGTFSYGKVNADVATTAIQGTFTTVDRCPVSVGLAIKIRGAALYVRRDSPQGLVRITPELVLRINRFDSDVEELLGPYVPETDPVLL